MFLTTHTVVGVLISQHTPTPLIAFSLGFLSHFLLDFIPHGDEQLLTAEDKEHGRFRKAALASSLDVALTVAFFLFLYSTVDLHDLGQGFRQLAVVGRVGHVDHDRVAEVDAVAGDVPEQILDQLRQVGREHRLGELAGGTADVELGVLAASDDSVHDPAERGADQGEEAGGQPQPLARRVWHDQVAVWLPEVIELPDAARQDPTFFRTEGKLYGRDGCRVPIPWEADAPAAGFSPTGESWLPQPESWGSYARDAQRDVPGSTLALYTDAIAARREHALATGEIEWLDAAPDVIAFRSGDVTVIANTGATPVPLPAGDVLLASGPVGDRLLPGDTTVWLTGA